MEYDHRYSLSPPTTPPAKPKHHRRHCFTSCFRPAAGDSDGEEHSESPHRPLAEHSSRCLGLAFHGGRGRHRHRPSTEFRYDPLSYALNFDEGPYFDSTTGANQLSRYSFSSRLPASPPSDGAKRGGGASVDRTIVGMDAPLRFSPI